MEERRKHARVQVQLPLKLFAQEADFITQSLNLSCGGVLCEINEYIPVMTRLKILMLLPMGKKRSQKIECEGIVVRIEPEQPGPQKDHYKIAIFFNRMKKIDRAKIAEYVQRQRASASQG
jgi:hypothetical protein